MSLEGITYKNDNFNYLTRQVTLVLANLIRGEFHF
jgi:hypothetical protein